MLTLFGNGVEGFDSNVRYQLDANFASLGISYTSIVAMGAKGFPNDDSLPIAAAFATGLPVYFPPGIWAFNYTITKPFIAYGAGSQSSILVSYAAGNRAPLIYNPNPTSPYWTYHSQVYNLGFLYNTTIKTGIGFTFGAESQAGYALGMEYANNVDFKNVRFYGLAKGVQFPFGNIGSRFDDCGWSGCFYGLYGLDNKTGLGSSMHAGNKYIVGGEFDTCDCAAYFNNKTSGYYGPTFTNTIFEYNSINVYELSLDSVGLPTSFVNCTTEGSGLFRTTNTTAIDVWTGNVVSAYNAPPHAMIFDGMGRTINYRGGSYTDVYLKASSTHIYVRDAQVEYLPGFGGQISQVDDAASHILYDNCVTNGGFPPVPRNYTLGQCRPLQTNVTLGNSQSRATFGSHRYNKVGGSYGANATVINLTAASNLGNGSFTVTAGTISDGIIYSTCNTWTIPFTASSQFTSIVATNQSIPAGSWVALTISLKAISGTNIQINSWDRSSNQLFVGVSIPETGVWYTLRAMGYFPNTAAGFLGIDFSSTGSGTCVMQGQAYQLKIFATQSECQTFLDSQVYIGP